MRFRLDEGGKLGALLDLLQLLLGLPELGQVEGGDLLGLLDLLLVGLDLGLQLGGEVGHPVLVLLVLTGSEGELLALALSALVSLGRLTSASLSRQAQPPAREPCSPAWPWRPCLHEQQRSQRQQGEPQAGPTGYSATAWTRPGQRRGPVQRAAHQQDERRQPSPSWTSPQCSWQRRAWRRPQPGWCGWRPPVHAWRSCRGHRRSPSRAGAWHARSCPSGPWTPQARRRGRQPCAPRCRAPARDGDRRWPQRREQHAR